MLQVKKYKGCMSRMSLQEARTPHSPQRHCFKNCLTVHSTSVGSLETGREVATSAHFKTKEIHYRKWGKLLHLSCLILEIKNKSTTLLRASPIQDFLRNPTERIKGIFLLAQGWTF